MGCNFRTLMVAKRLRLLNPQVFPPLKL
jgi:hypothetical protein